MEIQDDVPLPSRLWLELVQWRAGYHCEWCERDREALKKQGLSGHLHAHHKDHNHSNNRLNNGECLCPPCHTEHHSKYRAASRKCEAGCTCGRHKLAWNRKGDGDPCKNDHADWFIDSRGKRACRACRREYQRNRYYSDPQYRQRKIDDSIRNKKIRTQEARKGEF